MSIIAVTLCALVLWQVQAMQATVDSVYETELRRLKMDELREEVLATSGRKIWVVTAKRKVTGSDEWESDDIWKARHNTNVALAKDM